MSCRMRAGRRGAAAALAAAVAIAARAWPGDAAVVATVNGEPITEADLVRELMIRNGKAVLEDLIRQKAIEQEVARARVSVTEDEVANEIERERRDLARIEERRRLADPRSGPAKTLEQIAEEKYHMSFEGYRQIVRRWLLIRKLLLRRENPSENEVMLWFYQNRERYDTPAQITARHVYIPKEDPGSGRPRTHADVQARIDLVRRALIDGVDFAAVARRYSEDLSTRDKGGDLGTIDEHAARANLEPAFAAAMIALKPGQSGGPIETPKGYHFIHVMARQEGTRAEYERLRARVRVDYLEDRALLLREVFLRELMDRTVVTRDFTIPTRPGEQ